MRQAALLLAFAVAASAHDAELAPRHAPDATRLNGTVQDATCIPEWQTCSPNDDSAAACCLGLYCWVQDAYYAQCRTSVSDDDVPTPTDDGDDTPPPVDDDDGGPSPYGCGTVISGALDYVTEEYENWKNTYIVQSANGACVSQPTQGGKCVSEVRR